METEKLFYEDAYITEFDANVTGCTESLYDGKKVWLIELDRTAFYPEGGGQPADTGTLFADGGQVNIRHTANREGKIVHFADSALSIGTKVRGVISWDRRFDHMQQHSGEHIVSGMICERFNCDNVGFHMGEKTVIIDYNADIDMESLKEIEKKANRYIWENHAVNIFYPNGEDLDKLKFRSKIELTEAVRIVEFPGADICACCGTHVKLSAEVGMVKFISCQKFTKGTRIGLVCGKRAFDFLSVNFEENSSIAVAMASGLEDTSRVYHKQMEEFKETKFRLSKTEEEYYKLLAEKYTEKENVMLFDKGLSSDSLRKLCVLLGHASKGMCAVFSLEESSGDDEKPLYKYAVLNKDSDIRDFIKKMNLNLNGRGGGKDGFAQGSIKAEKREIRKFFEAEIGHMS